MSPLPLATVVLALVVVSQVPTVQTLFSGGCPKVEPQATVNLADLKGVWYEQSHYLNDLENNKLCIMWNFTTTSTTSMNVNTVMTSAIGNGQTTIGATITRTGTNGQFTYRITALPGLGWGVNYNYNFKFVAVTPDYIVPWFCRNIFLNIKNEQMMWILTRTRTPTADVITAAIAAADAQNLDTNRLITVNQTNC